MGKGPVRVAAVLARLMEEAMEGVGPGRKGPGRRTFAIFEAFERIGPPLTDHAEPSSFRRGRLTLRVDSSAWMTELGMMQRPILERVNGALPHPWVEEIRLVLGPPRPRRRAPVHPSRTLAAEHRAKLSEWSAPLRDDALRAAFERAAGTALAAGLRTGEAPVSGPPGPRVVPLTPWEEETPVEERLTYGYGDRSIDRWRVGRRAGRSDED